MIDFKALLRKKEDEGRQSGYSAVEARGVASSDQTFYNALLKHKEIKAKVAEKQKPLPPMPHADLKVPQMDAVKNFFDDRQYDDKPYDLDGPANMAAVVNTIRKEQGDEFMHSDENTRTFSVIKETNTNPHPYAEYFKREQQHE
jgi:hypothetical protein